MAQQKVVLFFSCEPGGAEVLIPVIKLLKRVTSHKVIVLSYGIGAERFNRKGVEYTEIKMVAKDDATILNAYCPDIVITSAASLPERDMSEKYLWREAKRVGIPTVAFLDQWQNYVVRFSGPNTDERLAYIPDFINCINDIGEMEMIRQGVTPNVLVKFGQPYLSSLSEDIRSVNLAEIKERIGVLSGRKVVMFASEAIREHYGHARGYDQYDALKLFLTLIENSLQQCELLIKLHPKDVSQEFESILSSHPKLSMRIIRDELSPLECIAVSEEVFGMTSIMLIEAHILGKKSISLQPGLVGEDFCVLSRFGVIPLLSKFGIRPSESLWSFKIKSDFEIKIKFEEKYFLEFFDQLC